MAWPLRGEARTPSISFARPAVSGIETRQRGWERFDPILLGAVVVAIVLGIALIFSATLASGELGPDLLDSFFARQIIYTLLGLALLMGTARIDYRSLGLFHRPIYALALLSLALVLLIGRISFGAQRWLDFQIFPFQPSEIAKLALIIFLARYFSQSPHQVRSWPRLALSLLPVVPAMLLIYLQPDLGTALVLGVIWVGMAFAAGARLRHLALMGLIAVLLAPLAWVSAQDYMRERILVFLDPSYEPLGAGYNMHQARIAIGSGGVLGKGYSQGSQSQLHFLRVRHTDFIFSVMGEELGFVGVLTLVTLFALIVGRLLRAAELARDDFGRLIAVGVATLIAFQAFANMGMNLGLLPASGTPLPFVSYGGSGLVVLLMGIGLVESVIMRHRKLDFIP